MNPLTNVKNITKLNEIELARGTTDKKSWHDMYKESAWIFIGGLAYGLTEGDILAVFSQYGEIMNINLVRDKKTGKTKGYCFLCYENQKSTILAVDNFNGIKLCNRTIRVDHVANYKPPKDDEKDDDITKMLKSEGCAPKSISMNETPAVDSKLEKKKNKKMKKEKKVKKEKKEHKKKKKHNAEESDSEKEHIKLKKIKIKEEKHDPEYDKYDMSKKAFVSEKDSKEGSTKKSLGEGSSQMRHKSEASERHHKNREKILDRKKVQYRSSCTDEERLNFRKGEESNSSRQYNNKECVNKKPHERYSSYSSSSDDSPDSSSSENCSRYKSDTKYTKNKYVNYKKDCRNSNYKDSNSEPSSDVERDKSQGKIFEKENYKTRNEASSFYRSKDKLSYGRKNSDDDTSNRNRTYYEKDEKYLEYQSKSRNRDDESSEKYFSYHKHNNRDRR